MEIALKGQLGPLPTHVVVLGVALVQPQVVVHLVGLHGGHPAQQMGGELGLSLAHRGGLNLHPFDSQLFHPGDEVHVHILGEVIGRPVGNPTAVVELVEHPRHRPGVGRRHVPDVQGGHRLAALLRRRLVHRALAFHAEAFAHHPQQLLGGGQLIGLRLLLRGLLLLTHTEEVHDLVP